MVSYDTAAKHIDSLYKKIHELTDRADHLDDEIEASRLPHHYMTALIKVIKDNPGLLYGWQYFLSAANIEEPSWKHEYESEYV
jgi:hypothetical protein